MERPETQMIELPDLEKEVLNLCLFEERFDVICDEVESTQDPNVIADAIKNLLHYKLLTAFNEDKSDMGWMYDVDRMKDSKFISTAKGHAFILS